MPAYNVSDLWPLEEYARRRAQFRADVIEVKKLRTVHLGQHLTFQFENAMTIRYQIQEMLRIERTFEEDGIKAELDAYNPLIPNGSNLKATLLIEYEEQDERRIALERLKGIEHHLFLKGSAWSVNAIADEDIERSNDQKTSAVHFLRFELPAAAIEDIKNGGMVTLCVEHPEYTANAELREPILRSLRQDLQ